MQLVPEPIRPVNMSVRELARILGGEAHGRHVYCPGPGHSRRDRSLSIPLDPHARTVSSCIRSASAQAMRCASVGPSATAPTFKPQKLADVIAADNGIVADIKSLSKDLFEERTVYSHTGWRLIDGAWRFLHADGALGENGCRTDIEVDLPEQLCNFKLIEPQDDADLIRAVRESLCSNTWRRPA
jgi:hypothetical protein